MQGKIKFHEDPQTHEYQSEDSALKDYLEQNPHEIEDVKKEEEAVLQLGGSQQDESSDDVDEPTTPRDESIKSNTPLSHSTGGYMYSVKNFKVIFMPFDLRHCGHEVFPLSVRTTVNFC